MQQLKDPVSVNFFHILVVGPALTYLGYKGVQKEPVPDWVWKIVLATGVLIIFAHAYLAYKKQQQQ